MTRRKGANHKDTTIYSTSVGCTLNNEKKCANTNHMFNIAYTSSHINSAAVKTTV